MAILLTGASSGFGEAMARVLVGAGYRVIGAARREARLAALKAELGDLFLPCVMDVADAASVDAALQGLPEDFADIDCLINNAGLALGLEAANEVDFADWQTMIQTNVFGLSYVTHRVLPQLVASGRGYVINIGSVAGTYPYPGGNVYGATKAFVRQFSLNLRADLADKGVRVSNVEPGLCGGTEFSQVRFKGDEARAASVYDNVQSLSAEDIAQTVLWLYQRPAHVNVNSIELMPTAQAFGALAVHRSAAADTEIASVKGGFFAKLAGYLKG